MEEEEGAEGSEGSHLSAHKSFVRRVFRLELSLCGACARAWSAVVIDPSGFCSGEREGFVMSAGQRVWQS